METRIRAAFIRGGSSKGTFFLKDDLPADRSRWDDIFLTVTGSPDPYNRQLNGMGGGLSSVSKVMVIGLSDRADAEIEYTFGQVAVDKPVVDYSANCGNLSSAVAPFALQRGLISVPKDATEAEIRIYNTNTKKILVAKFPVRNGLYDPRGDCEIPGVAGTGAPIAMNVLDPGGSATPGLMPTGAPVDTLELLDGSTIEASMIDACNAAVFVRASDLGLTGRESPDEIEAMPGLMDRLDRIRRAAGVRMGLGATPEDVPLGIPKIAFVAPPMDYISIDKNENPADSFDIAVRMISMERVHRALPLTAVMCVAAAARIPGSLTKEASRPVGDEVRIGTPSGCIVGGADVDVRNDTVHVEKTRVFRTMRMLMDGEVIVPDTIESVRTAAE